MEDKLMSETIKRFIKCSARFQLKPTLKSQPIYDKTDINCKWLHPSETNESMPLQRILCATSKYFHLQLSTKPWFLKEEKGSGLLYKRCYFMLIFANCTHWLIHSDNLDNHPFPLYDNNQNISVILCKKPYLKILSQLKWWTGIDYTKKNEYLKALDKFPIYREFLKFSLYLNGAWRFKSPKRKLSNYKTKC